MTPAPYTMADLQRESGYQARTIRSWIKAGVLPRPEGTGRGASYTEQHLERLLFIRKLRSKVDDRRMPLPDLRRIFEALTGDQVSRVASGEEPLEVADVSPWAPSLWSEHADPPPASMRPRTTVNAPAAVPVHEESPRPYGRAEAEPHTTIEVADGVELRMRGDDPERVAWLAKLARRVREWIREGG
jgi:DNA-binding transcriptional MerR regulator